MMKHISKYLVALAMAFCPLAIVAQTGKLTTEGTDFLVVFLSNGSSKKAETVDLMLYFSGRQDGTVTISNLNNSSLTKKTISITKNTMAEYSVPQNQRQYAYFRYASPKKNVENISLYVHSTTPISLYAVDAFIESTGATGVLPVSVLGTEYVLQSFESNFLKEDWGKSRDYSGQFAVVATEDNTEVTITPTIELQNDRPANQPFTIPLPKKGQSYFCRGIYERDSSICGTTISSNKPIAVFQGNSGGTVPKNEDGSDHMYEQAAPINMLGKTFGLPKISIAYDLIRFTALHDNTDIKVNNSLMKTLKAHETYEYKLSGAECFVETSMPVVCNSFLSGAGVNCIGEYIKDSIGDPAMIVNPPLEQMVDTITFAATTPKNIGKNSSQIEDYYVSIVTRAGAKGKIKLDGTTIANADFSTFSANSQYVYARKKVSKGAHTLTGDGEAFMATVYCIGKKEAYAYNAGCGANLLYDTVRIQSNEKICYADRPFVWRKKQLYTDTVCSDTVHVTEGLKNFDTIYTLTLRVSEPLQYLKKDTSVCDTLLPYTWYGHTFEKADSIVNTYKSKVFTLCDSLQLTLILKTFPVCYDSLVYRKWKDVLFCANGDHRIVAYQWFKNTEEIVGENNQYLYCPQGFDGVSTYFVRATCVDGTVIETCPKVFEKTPASAASYVKMNTAVRRGSPIHIEMSDQEAVVNIYTVLGVFVGQTVIYSQSAEIPIALPAGVYIVQVNGANINENVKILVD